MAREHESYIEHLAPYVLGALPPLDAEALEKHLRACVDCQRELGELRTGAEALARSVERIEPPPSLRERLLAEVSGAADASATAPDPATRPASPHEIADDASAAEQQPARARRGRAALARLRSRGSLWSRPAFAGLAIGLVALVAGVGGWALGTARMDEPRSLAATIDRQRLPEASGRLTVTDDGDGPVLHLTGLRNLGPQRTYEIWVQRGGELAPGPLFSPTADGAAVTGIPGDTRDMEAVLVTRERAGGAPTPTETPIVSVPVPS